MKDVAKIPGLYRRGNKWYLRIVVPKDLVDACEGRAEIRQSLGTSDHAEAKQLANVARVSREAEFSELRKQLASKKTNNNPVAAQLSKARGLSIVQKYVAEREIARGKSELLLHTLDEEDKRDLAREDQIAVETYGTPGHPIGEKDVYIVGQKLLSKHGLNADYNTDGYAEFAELVRRALLEISRRAVAREKQDFSKTSFDQLFSPKALATNHLTLVEVCSAYFSEYKKTSGVKEKRVKKVEAAIGLIHEYFGKDTFVQSISRQNCRQFRDALNVMPPNAKKRFPKKSLSEVIDYAKENGLVPLAYETQIQYLSVLHQILEWASREDFIEKNPASGIKPLAKKPDSSTAREVFKTEQLLKIFKAPIYTGCLNAKTGYAKPGDQVIRGGRFWCALIALYTGMRENEICQLKVTDIGTTEKGTHYIDNNAVDEDKSLKNPNSRRLIPIHPELISIGLLKHVENMKSKGEVNLFPDLR